MKLNQKLTPEILRAAADQLCAGDGSPGIRFMCWAIERVGRSSVTEFQQALLDHGVVAVKGDAMGNLRPRKRNPYGTDEERQAVRFMFLEFLALSMEDDQ